MDTSAMQADVIVVGAGPVGLALAVELGLRGRRVALLERDPQRGPQPRAKTLNMRSLEHLRRWGIADEVRRNSPRPDSVPTDVVFRTRLFGHHIATVPNIYFRGNVRQDDDRFCEPSEWVPQFVVEQALRRRLAGLENVTVHDGCSLEGVAQDSAGVVASVAGADGSQTLRARFLVGADGARSRVRDLIGSHMVGRHGLASHFNMVMRIPDLDRDPPEPMGIMHWIINPDSPSVMSPMGDVWYVGKTLPPGKEGLTDDEIREFLHATTGRAVDYEVLSSDRWFAHELIADKYRQGSVFLAGDACHLHPPFGGYGMNMGIADAVDLGWKLDAVLAGWGGDALLDTYEWERKRVHEWTIAEAIANYGVLSGDLVRPGIEEDTPEGASIRARLREEVLATKRREFHTIGVVLGYHYCGSPIVVGDQQLPDPSAEEYAPQAVPGALAPHAWLSPGVSLYDRLGPGFTLLDTGGDPESVRRLILAATEAGIPLNHLQIQTPAVLERYGSGLFLIRPDEHIAWAGKLETFAQARDVLAAVTGHRMMAHAD